MIAGHGAGRYPCYVQSSWNFWGEVCHPTSQDNYDVKSWAALIN